MRRWLEAASKIVVLMSAVVALAIQTRMGRPVWDELAAVTIGAALIAGVAARWSSATVWAVLLAAVPVVPVLFFAALGTFPPTFHAPWFAAALAAIVSARDVPWSRWAFPEKWRAPLASWALLLAVSWPIVAWREIDFSLSLSPDGGFGANALSGNGGLPSEVVGWMTTIALSQLIGLLFFDWVSAFVRRVSLDAFRNWVIVPAAAGALAAALLACVQGTVNVHFLNAHQWPALGRAGGGVLDGDAAGALMGMWVAGFLALAFSGRRAMLLFGVAGAVLSWGGLWATGSRMALLSGLISSAGLAFVLLPSFEFPVRRMRAIWLAGIALVVIVTLLVARNRMSPNDPLQRALDSMPKPTVSSIGNFMRKELFDRSGPYGTVSVRMMRQYPVAGVGIGMFETLLPDFSFEYDLYRYWKDNAQSWYRNQFAELGVVGSAGWLAWCVMLIGFAWSARAGGERRTEAFLVCAALTAVAVVGLVAMPTRSVFVGFSVWIFIAWLTASASAEARRSIETPTWRSNWFAWVLAAVIPLVAARDLWLSAHGSLRPAERAVRADWNYQYGLYQVELDANGEPYRWTSSRAVAVATVARSEYLRIAIRSGPPDLAKRPFGYTLRLRDSAAAFVTATDGAPREWYVHARPGETKILVEIQTSRAWRPADSSGTDYRTLGVILGPFTSVNEPPPGAIVIR